MKFQYITSDGGIRIRNVNDPKSIAIIEKYQSKMGSNPTPEQQMIYKLLIQSGDDMPHDCSTAAGFQKAYRVGEVIYSTGLGNSDTIMWHLMHMDSIIWEVLKEEGLE